MGDQHRLEHRPDVAAPVPQQAPPHQHEAEHESAVPIAIPGLAKAEPLRRAGSDPLGGSAVDAGTERSLRSPSGGSVLDGATRQGMESAFGADFGDVRVHTDQAAATMSRDLQATAFTHGTNIFFSQGSYDPGSERGRHLLAHELTHVVQRKQGRDTGAPALSAHGSDAPTIGRADDPLEAEADRVASTVVGALRRATARQTEA